MARASFFFKLRSFRALLGGSFKQIFAVVAQLFLQAVTSTKVSGLNLNQRRRHALALVACHVASGMELASLRRTDGAGNIALQEDPLAV